MGYLEIVVKKETKRIESMHGNFGTDLGLEIT